MTTMETPAEACMINIGPRERRRRMRFGIVGFAVGVGLAIALVAVGAHRLSRLSVLVPCWIGALGYLQAREKT